MKPMYVLAIGKRYGTRFLLKQNAEDPNTYKTLFAQESAGDEWFNFGEAHYPWKLSAVELENFKTYEIISEKDLLVELL